MYDISMQMKIPIVCSNDARLCYDIIVHVTAFLTLRRLGIPKPMIISMLHTIKMMEHIVRTSFGYSTATYGGSEWRLPRHVSIQGNGSLTLIWAAISTVLFLSLNKRNYVGMFYAPKTKLLTSLVGFAFVDDTYLLQNQHHNDEIIEEIVEELQGSLDVWQGTLQCLGGSLDSNAPIKSY